MAKTFSYDEFAVRLNELSDRIQAAKSTKKNPAVLDQVLSSQHMSELTQRYEALHAQFKGTDKRGWKMAKSELSNSLTDLLTEFGHLFMDADAKFRHRKD